MVNRVTLIGHLGNDVELKYTQNGVAVASFNIATTEKWKGSSGDLQERTEWHRIVAWKQLAETCSEHLKKGSKVYIDGKISTRKWQDDSGQERTITEIQAQQVKFL